MTHLAPTLAHAMEQAAAHQDRGFHHLHDERQDARFVSYSELYRRARRVAAALQAAGVHKGDRVALILPESITFVDTMFGCLLAGVIAVPMYPPMNLAQLPAWVAGCGHTLRQAGACMVVTDAQVRPLLGTLLDSTPSLRRIETLDALVHAVAPDAAPRNTEIRPDDVAFLQFTSGSTARPKGVTLTHANLMANIRAIGVGLGASGDTRAVSWLPLYHDMGLIGFVLAPVAIGCGAVTLMSPLLFLKRPALWLRQLSERRAQVSFAPNFAYGLACTRVRDAEIAGIDLSALEVAGCGAEPIQHPTLRTFLDRYAPYGLRRQALLPCYGLAEHGLAVTFIGRDEEISADRVDPSVLAAGEAKPPEGESALEVVCCGRPFEGHQLRISDEEGHVLPEGQVGQIQLSGPSVMQGYWGDTERSAAALKDDWLSTGDLGYLKSGALYVTGRIKDLIILNGRNYYPSDLEWHASQVKGVRRGNVVAFGVTDPALGRERVVMVAETRETEGHDRLAEAIIAGVLQALSLRVDEVLLMPPGSLPKTSSGKLQRARAAELYRRGQLGRPAAGKLGLAAQMFASRWAYLKAGLKRRTPPDQGNQGTDV